MRRGEMKVTCIEGTTWIDVDTGERWWGIRVKANNSTWFNAAEDHKALLFTDRLKRNAKMKELRARLGVPGARVELSPAPRYDDVYFAGMAALEAADDGPTNVAPADTLRTECWDVVEKE
jgi:hypothetical protein